MLWANNKGNKLCRSVTWLLSKIIFTATPRLLASINACAIGFEVKEYAATLIDFSARLIVLIINLVAPCFGEKAVSKLGVVWVGGVAVMSLA